MPNVTIVEFEGWKAELKAKELVITKDGETRIYDIKQSNEGIEYDPSLPEYMYIRTKNFYYQFKFETFENNFFGDKFTNNNEHMGEIACCSVNND